MTRLVFILTSVLPAALAIPPGAADGTIQIELHPQHVLNRIDEKIYGHFYEHIYHSAHGGLWGEVVLNRSFEIQEPAAGNWQNNDGEIHQTELGVEIFQPLGESLWQDYELSLEARVLSGVEGFLILLRYTDDNHYYWWNLGGWENHYSALESVSGDTPRRQISPNQDFTVKPDVWYKIRVRCEKNHFQGWIDDQLVMDFVDTQSEHMQGAVGIGSWVTQAAFRNLKVTSLDGQTLLEATPDQLPWIDSISSIEHWEDCTAISARKVYDGLNGSIAVLLENRAGISQASICANSQDPLRGSLWAKSAGQGLLAVRLVSPDENKQLAAQQISVSGSDWSEVSLELKPSHDCQNARLEIESVGSDAVLVDQICLMPETAIANDGFRLDLYQAIAGLEPPIIRWPGGCFAERYRWKDAIGPQHTRTEYPVRLWDDQDGSALGTDEFMTLCRKLGAEPLIVINSGTYDPDVPREEYIREACQWLEYCNGSADSQWGAKRAANGHSEPYQVKYWEIDNETWRVGPDEYIQIVKEFVPALKAVDPNIRIIVCGSAGYDDFPMSDGWNRRLIGACAELFDYLSIHHYEAPEQFRHGPLRYENLLAGIARMIADSANPDIKVYVSEWNAQSTDWRTGLYCGGILNAFERCGDSVTLAGPALFLRHVKATDWDNAFINFDQCGWFPAPNYVVMKLWREHYAPERIAMYGDLKGINAVATHHPGQHKTYLKMVNPLSQSFRVEVQVAQQSGLSAQCQLVAPESLSSRNDLGHIDVVKPNTVPVQIESGRVCLNLPALSAGVLTISMKGE